MNDLQLQRYSRQLMLPDIDIEGQQRILAAHVVILGLGGLGSPASLYLAAAGVGKLTLIDRDVVELSNLHRQVLYQTRNITQNKAHAAQNALNALNPDCEMVPLAQLESAQALLDCLRHATLVLDCSDNYDTRVALNAASLVARLPLVSAAAIRTEAQIAVFRNDQSHAPCYQCLFPRTQTAQEHCSTSGVLGPVLGIAGSIQALEALKLIAGMDSSLSNKLLAIDAKSMRFRTIQLTQDAACPSCNNLNHCMALIEKAL